MKFPGSISEADVKKYAYVVKVPKPHPSAYNPERPISDLVRNQIMHLSLAERHLEKRHRTGKDVHSIKTEREAGEYIAHLTKKLHGKVAKKKVKRKSAKPAGRKSKSKRGKKK